MKRLISIKGTDGMLTPPQPVAKPTLQPRDDINLDLQRFHATRDRAEAREKQLQQDQLQNSLYGVHSPQGKDRVGSYNRHALRLLILEAGRYQHSMAAATQKQSVVHQDPMALGGTIAPRTPVGYFDLTEGENMGHLVKDIETLMAAAVSKPVPARDRFLNQALQEISKLRLWHDTTTPMAQPECFHP